MSYFYLYKLDPSNEEVFKTSLAAASAGIIFFNTDTDFYNYYGKNLTYSFNPMQTFTNIYLITSKLTNINPTGLI